MLIFNLSDFLCSVKDNTYFQVFLVLKVDAYHFLCTMVAASTYYGRIPRPAVGEMGTMSGH